MTKKRLMPKVGDIVTIKITPSKTRLDLPVGKLEVKVTELSSWKDFFFAIPTKIKLSAKDYMFSKKELVI
jgi:hypothetical protein